MKNWTAKEAVAVITAGTDKEAIKEIVKHFPLFAVIVAGKDFNAFADALPEHVTVRKLENELSNGTEDSDTEEDTDGADETEESVDEDLESMSTKELIKLCDKRGIKVPKYGKNKQFYLDALSGGSDEAEEEEEAEEEVKEDPIALYKQCKKAGLNVKPKQSAKYYKDQLAKVKAAEEEADDEDWGDDEEEVEEKPAKPAKGKSNAKTSKPAEKPAKASGKAKAKPAEETEEEDDDDWDI